MAAFIDAGGGGGGLGGFRLYTIWKFSLRPEVTAVTLCNLVVCCLNPRVTETFSASLGRGGGGLSC